MAKDDQEIDYVDYTSIQFPSDHLTSATLRRLYPAEFDDKGPPSLPVDPIFEKIAAEHGKPLPPHEPDWLLGQLRAQPGDQTIGDLRRQRPDVFDVEGGLLEIHECYEASSDVSNMLWLERVLARIAYHETFGTPRAVGPWPSGIELPERDGYREDLTELYEKLGLADEKSEGRQMITKFEAAATRQAAADRHPPRYR